MILFSISDSIACIYIVASESELMFVMTRGASLGTRLGLHVCICMSVYVVLQRFLYHYYGLLIVVRLCTLYFSRC